MRSTNSKRSLERALTKTLETSYLSAALPLIELEERKDHILCRMPSGIAIYDELWNVLHKLADTLKIKVRRGTRWPTVAELDEVLGQVKWLWQHWIPRGFLTLLVGEPGCGKSFIALDWIGRVINGTGWPTGEPTKDINPIGLWIETESSQQLLNTRSRSMGIDRSRIVIPGFGSDLLGQPDLMNEDDRQRVINVIDDTKPGLVVLDSLGGAHTRGENRIEEVRPMLDFLARLARDRETPIVAVHHLRKRNQGEDIAIGLDRVRGSSAFSAFARAIIAVDGVESNRVLRVIKTNLSFVPEPLNVNIEFRNDQPSGVKYSEWHPAPRKKTKKEKCAEWIISTLKSDGMTPLGKLISKGEGEGYTRGMIYDAREVIGDALIVTGNGRSANWALQGSPLVVPMSLLTKPPSKEDGK